MREAIGRAALRVAIGYLRRRYRWALRAGLGVAAVGAALLAYRAARNVPEG